MPRIALLLAPLLVVALAACDDAAQQAQTDATAAQPPGPPGTWPDRVDGNYKGAATLADAQSPLCPPTTFGKIEIGDRRLYFAYQPDTLFVAPIQADGTLFAKSGTATLEGTLLGERLAFIVRTPTCASSYDLNWVL